MDVAERDRRYMARAEPPDGVQVARSDGCFVFDHHGKKYIDFTAGWCVGNLGWGNDEVRAAIRGFDGPAYVHPDHLYRPWAELAEALAGIVPVKRAKCYRATGGSEAVEIALQVAMAATDRPGPGGVTGDRRRVRRGRGGHGLRADGQSVRVRALRPRPGRHVPGEGDHRGVRPDGRERGDGGRREGRRGGLLLDLRLAPALGRGRPCQPEFLGPAQGPNSS